MNARTALGLAALTLGISVGTAVQAEEPVRDDRLTSTERRIVREATKHYRNVDAALADGYVKVSECVEEDGLGGMGFHYLRPDLAGNPDIDPAAPEILVYVPHTNGSMRLAAVEYWAADADQNLGTDDDRPLLFDRLAFNGPMPGHDPMMPVHYDLHVWLYDHNPAGQLAPFNPAVSCDA